LPLPVGSAARGGADGIFKTADSTSSSLSNFPLCMNRNRCRDVEGSSFDRIRCFKAMTVVSSGSGMSSKRSGTEVVNLTVMLRGGGSIPTSTDPGKEDIAVVVVGRK
jgi:hypothetical protein